MTIDEGMRVDSGGNDSVPPVAAVSGVATGVALCRTGRNGDLSQHSIAHARRGVLGRLRAPTVNALA